MSTESDQWHEMGERSFFPSVRREAYLEPRQTSKMEPLQKYSASFSREVFWQKATS